MARWGDRISGGPSSKLGMPRTSRTPSPAISAAANRPSFPDRASIRATPSRLVRAAGGVPVLAHPFSAGGVESVLDRLVPAGLAGMEVDYGEYGPQDREILRQIAARRGLIATGGSDYHGPDLRAARELGSAPVPLAAVAALREAAVVRR